MRLGAFVTTDCIMCKAKSCRVAGNCKSTVSPFHVRLFHPIGAHQCSALTNMHSHTYGCANVTCIWIPPPPPPPYTYMCKPTQQTITHTHEGMHMGPFVSKLSTCERYGTCHNKVTVLRPCNGYRYGRRTGTGTGVARVRVRA